MWAVRCEVWGGVTGHRQSLLRQGDQVLVFRTEKAAQAQADKCKQAVRSAYATAQFWYEPVQLPLTQGEQPCK